MRDRLETALADARRRKSKVGLLYLDLDHFKPINDKLGHDAGDLVLEGVGSRLKENTRESDTIARIGGDEFVVVLCNQSDYESVLHTAQKIQAAISVPYKTGSELSSIGVSIGVALYPDDAKTSEALLKAADAALYAVKETGRGKIRRAGSAHKYDKIG